MGCKSSTNVENLSRTLSNLSDHHFNKRSASAFFDVHEFNPRSFVPLDTFACPMQGQEPEAVAERLLHFSRECSPSARAQAQAMKKRPFGLRGRRALQWPTPPGEAVCRVQLTHAKVLSQDNTQLRDPPTGNDTALSASDFVKATLSASDFVKSRGCEVKFSGGLLFPPRASWKTPATSRTNALSFEQTEKDDAFMLPFDVWVQIKTVKDATKRGSYRFVTAVCRRIKTRDPVADSWLPLNDIMKCVELILTKKAEEAMDKAFEKGMVGFDRKLGHHNQTETEKSKFLESQTLA